MQLRGRGLEGMLGPTGMRGRHARAAGAQLGPANWAMNDGDADDNAADARDVSLKGGCLIPFVAGLCC